MIEYLIKACEVSERGAALPEMRRICFKDARLQSFNGVVHFQAPSGLASSEAFMVSEDRLLAALRSCSEKTEIGVTKDFLRLKTGPLIVRVRKLEGEAVFYNRLSIPASAKNQKAEGLREVLLAIRDFISTDASRPWSVAALLHDGWAHATNNLALVRVPLPKALRKLELKLPVAGVNFLCELPSLDHYHIDDHNHLIINCDKMLVRIPQSLPEWPDLSKFFAKMPKRLPPISEELRLAVESVQKFSERFVSLDKVKVAARAETIESDYEIDFAKAKGTFNAPLLRLILSSSTHIDFSTFPEPIFFSNSESGLEGTAIGASMPA